MPSREELRLLTKDQLIDIIFEQANTIIELTKRIELLEAKILPRKTSNNSSIPPSTDITRGNRETRKPKKKGPPFGHKGTSRRISTHPDHTIWVDIERCPRTGEPVHTKSRSYKRHQILELKPAELLVIEIRRQTTTGPDGKTIVAPNPVGIRTHQRTGPVLKAHVSYMRYQQNVPWLRILDWLKEMCGGRIAVGTLNRIFNELKTGLESEYQRIGQDIRASQVVGVDETGMRINGKRHWTHVFRTDQHTYFKTSRTRGHEVSQEILGETFSGTLVSDFWGVYQPKYFPFATFQKCLSAHGLRHIFYAMDCEEGKGDYALRLGAVIAGALMLREEESFGTPEYQKSCKEIEQELDELLSDDVNTVTEAGRRLWKLFRRYRDSLFRFLYDPALPSDNNGSERDIRERAVERKITGGYRSLEGAYRSDVAKSILSTLRKQHGSIQSMFHKAFGAAIYDTS